MTIATWNWLIIPVPLINNNAQWITNTSAQQRSYSNWLDFAPQLPPTFPTSGVIHRVWLGANSSKPMPTGGQLDVEMWVDFGGVYFNTAIPLGAQNGNARGLQWLGLKITSENFMTEIFDFSTPIAWDHGAGDKIALEVASSVPLDWVSLNLTYEF